MESKNSEVTRPMGIASTMVNVASATQNTNSLNSHLKYIDSRSYQLYLQHNMELMKKTHTAIPPKGGKKSLFCYNIRFKTAGLLVQIKMKHFNLMRNSKVSTSQRKGDLTE